MITIALAVAGIVLILFFALIGMIRLNGALARLEDPHDAYAPVYKDGEVYAFEDWEPYQPKAVYQAPRPWENHRGNSNENVVIKNGAEKSREFTEFLQKEREGVRK